MQLLARLALSVGAVALVLGGLVALYRVWTRPVNVEGVREYLRDKLESQTPSSLLREPSALYQGGKVVARVDGVTVDGAGKSIRFQRITGTINFLDPGPDPIIFGQYRLRCTKIESMTGTPPTPYLYEAVVCDIVGPA